mgnify:CR=1 FL=1
MRLNKEVKCVKAIVDILFLSSIYLITYLCIYEMLIFYDKSEWSFLIPIFVSVLASIINKIFIFNISLKENIITTIITFVILEMIIYFKNLNILYIGNKSTILTILTGFSLFTLLISKSFEDKKSDLISLNDYSEKDLFNLFYVNISKVQEIAMLIDNRIMKMVEKEQTSEELLKTSSSLTSRTTMLSGGTSIEKENNYKNRVYENFEVKMTKSLMLRKLYEVAKQNSNTKSMGPGQLVLIKDVELRRRNIDDTVMILNVLKDSKLKNQGDENIEVNMNKMMEKILEDFTIDYQFEQEVSEDCHSTKWLIQMPFKTNDNFENGYQHNDLQLGKLSIIGIYRGEIDFSTRESVSSKFLNILSNSYNIDNNSAWNDAMKDSCVNQEKDQIFPLNFKPNKLDEKVHLIDLIAIIQELKINKGTEDE